MSEEVNKEDKLTVSSIERRIREAFNHFDSAYLPDSDAGGIHWLLANRLWRLYDTVMMIVEDEEAKKKRLKADVT